MNTALVIVDVQRGFDEPVWGRRNNPHAEQNIAELLKAWRSANAPIFHFQHCSTTPNSPLRPGQPGNEFKSEAAPQAGEPVLQKKVNSCFIGTGLEQRLRDGGIDAIVLCGLTTDHCVSTTARMAANLGFGVAVVHDATATFERTSWDKCQFSAQEMHESALASLHREFASIISTAHAITMLRTAAAHTAQP